MPSLAGRPARLDQALDEITVHPRGWARVGAGVKWSASSSTPPRTGWPAVSGSITDVGIVGYTTGGGVGPMARTHGIAADKVRAIEVVTGDGQFRRVTPTEHPELFFALRGGKGAAGIVTALEFDLVQLPTFYGGSCSSTGPTRRRSSRLAGLVRRAAVPGRPRSRSSSCRRCPACRSRSPVGMTLSVRFLWTGNPADGERWFARLRSVARPMLDGVGVQPYPAIDCVHTDPIDPTPAHEFSTLLSGFDEATRTRCSTRPVPTRGRRRCWSRSGSSAARTRSTGRIPTRSATGRPPTACSPWASPGCRGSRSTGGA